MAAPAVLVTGGAGFVGSHACKALAAAGYLPVTVDNLSTGHADAVKWGPLERVDVRDRAGVEAALRRHGAQAVMHFAAFAVVAESVAHPDRYYDNNVGGLIALLAAMRAAGVGRLVFSSSCATYGVPPQLPIREDSPQAPINPYGRTKLMGEQMIRDHAAAFGLRFALLRYFNAAGADPGGELSERHDPETRLIPLALMAAAGTHPALKVYGTDYATPDGTCIRDYIHVADLAEAHLRALRHLEAGGEDLALNLGTGQGRSIREVCAAVARLTGKTVPVEDAPRRPGDPPELVADPSEAARLLRFRARMSDLDSIVRDAAPHFGLEVRHGCDA
ncbi:UDP-glucose 4-epimerase GalE [Roseicyclus persicicus]|uniref:UDP-glucose 4-epimerase n=1 Tax=Roseicyclus persicicus TaxID=2650661 RepID=A0A7X6H094_9RHOB|nr:UDP-glucose 4-epimerase GalE [Roseibacterium persicicum]NKX45654.1 UDP-glucose 4-epimerase GalE [Roseibacterium persicicum]